jgi:hypothetical protein
VVAVPKRLKHKIGETQRHDALRNFLAEIVVDAIHLGWGLEYFYGYMVVASPRYVRDLPVETKVDARCI